MISILFSLKDDPEEMMIGFWEDYWTLLQDFYITVLNLPPTLTYIIFLKYVFYLSFKHYENNFLIHE